MTNEAKAKRPPWRDFLPVHEAANLLPRMGPEELQELAKDIAKNGLINQIILHPEKGGDVLIDGVSRMDAMYDILGMDLFGPTGNVITHLYNGGGRAKVGSWDANPTGFIFKRVDHRVDMTTLGTLYAKSNFDVTAYVLSVNVHRRHLTSAQKRELIETLLRREPHKSDRQIAKLVGASHHTVAAVRPGGQFAHLPALVFCKGRPASQRAFSLARSG